MNVLIVDDQLPVIRGIIEGVDWTRLLVDRVFQATSAYEARTVYEHQSVDIMLCDIEMPGGNGIELVEWVRGASPDTINIFLTSHMDFGYAHSAIQLDCFDYLVQPVSYADLSKCLFRAIDHIIETRKLTRLREYGAHWADKLEQMRRQFWKSLLFAGMERANVSTEAAQLDIAIDVNRKYIVALVQLIGIKMQLDEYGDDDALLFLIEKEIAGLDDPPRLLACERVDGLLALVIDADLEALPVESVQKCMNALIRGCEAHISTRIACYISDPCIAYQFKDAMSRLLLAMYEEKRMLPVCYVITEKPKPFNTVMGGQSMPDAQRLSDLIGIGDMDQVVLVIEEYLKGLTQQSDTLNRLSEAVLNAVFNVMLARKIPVTALTDDKRFSDMRMNAVKSETDFLLFLRYVLDKYTALSSGTRDDTSIIHKVKEYISAHIGEEISRHAIADHVFLSEDHLSHVFSKETGESLSNYITKQRVIAARELLSSTQIPVSMVAMKSGFSNFSYFTKVFKRSMGMTPMDYRKRVQRKR